MQIDPPKLFNGRFFILVLCFFFFFSCSESSTFTVTNNCLYSIWPGTLAGAGTPPLPTTGFRLDPGQSVRIPSTPGWSGRIWGRTGCTFDASGVGTCQTGDCGGKLECDGNGAIPPASLFEITLGAGNDKDYYDVSLVDGYNLPIVVIPQGVYGDCNATGCTSDINMGCPKELQVVGGEQGNAGGVVACKSACEAFRLDQYCCSGQFANPTTCRPSFYSSVFKRACPQAYSYAFDDGTSTFTCKAYNYAIVFCPTTNGVKTSDGAVTPPPPSIQDPGLPSPAFQDPDLPTPSFQDPGLPPPVFQYPNLSTPSLQEPGLSPPGFQDSDLPTPSFQDPTRGRFTQMISSSSAIPALQVLKILPFVYPLVFLNLLV